MGPLKLFYRCRYECLKTLYWTPIVLVLCLVVWNYYVNVFVLNLSGNDPLFIFTNYRPHSLSLSNDKYIGQYTQPFSGIVVHNILIIHI